MTWDDHLFAALDDLEQQAEALYDAERAPELADRSRAEYRRVTLAGRLMASVGSVVTVHVRGAGALHGELLRVADGWCHLEGDGGVDWVVLLPAVTAVEGCSPRAVPEVAWPVTARLGVASALRRLAEAGERCVLHAVDGAPRDGVLLRVGADFVELDDGTARPPVLVVIDALAAVQSRG